MRRISQLRSFAFFACCAVGAIHASSAKAQSSTEPSDAVESLFDRISFLPVPIIITEPAVGYGGGAALLLFRRSLSEAAAASGMGDKSAPPDIYGIAIAATENGTKAAGAGAMISFDQQRLRYRGGIGRANVNLDFYGIGGALNNGDFKIGYSLDGWFTSQQILRRLGPSDHFLTLRWVFLDLKSSFDGGVPVLPDKSLSDQSSGIGIGWEHDSRDNIFTPSRGWSAAIDTLFYTPGIGSDNTFQTYRGHAFSYWSILQSLVLGARLDVRAARGDTPFFQLPYIDLRGIPAARYQDKNAAMVEAELRWNFARRWAVVGFAGAGRAWGSRANFSDISTQTTKGAGVRYLALSKLGLYVGLDYAKGPEDHAIYIQVGSAWR